MFGLLNIDKPPHMTSRDVVNCVQRLLRGVKIGHAGTLDPLATGVLVIALGPATRLVEYVQRMPKTYVGTFLLGRSSDTEDIEGNVVEVDHPPQPTRQDIEAALPAFVGTIQQRPPAFSALKIQGQRAYDLARRGEQVELQTRPIDIHHVKVRRYEYPALEVEVCCGSGTYIRSLGRDVALSLGTAAVMSALVRTAIGAFRISEAMELDQLTSEAIESHLLPPRRAVAQLPSAQLTEEETRRVANGLPVGNRWKLDAGEIAALDDRDRLIAILVPRGQGDLGPVRNFSR
jgi:tRNA pseudouridine55 synthase